MTLGPFTVAPDGTLAPRAPGLRPALRFAWRGRRCEARWQDGVLHLSAIAARIPSSAGQREARRRAFAALPQLPAGLPAGLGLRLTPDHRLALEAEAKPPATAAGLITALVRFALEMDPVLDRIEAAGAGQAAPPQLALAG